MTGAEFSEYYCSAEWHIARLKSTFAMAIYSFALRISNKSGRFSCSTENLADYFKCDRKSISRAIGELKAAGFFKVISEEPFNPTVYEVVTHKKWAEANQGKCTSRIKFPWSGIEEDELGRQLWAASGQRLRFMKFQLAAFRKSGLHDAAIISNFKAFLDRTKPKGSEWKYVIHNFRKSFVGAI